MAIWTKAILLGPVTVDEVASCLEADHGATVRGPRDTFEPRYKELVYDEPGTGRVRSMGVFTDGYAKGDWEHVHPGDGTLVMLGQGEEAVKAVQSLAERFGGFVLENDLDPTGWRPVEARAPEASPAP